MISLCIISRKEDQKALEDAIESTSHYVDEVIVVDTSTEGKIWAKAEHPFDKHTRIIPFKWTNDFAAARNFSFEQAKGDVLFWIDSDDTVTNPENLPKLAKLIEDGEADWIYSQYNYHRDEHGDVDAMHWKPRLFRKGTVKWEKTVHEDTVPTTGVIQVKDVDTKVATIVIEHHSDAAHHESSAKRNLGIMMAEYAKDGDKTDPRTLQYIGMALEGLGKYQEAIPYFHKHVEKSGSQSDRFWSLHRIAGCLHNSGDTRNAISVLMDSLKLFPEWKTAYYDLAAIYYDLGDFDKTIEWTLTGMDKQVPDILDVINPLDYHVYPLVRLAEAYMQLNKPEFALDTAKLMMERYAHLPIVKEVYSAAKEHQEIENYVAAFLKVVGKFREYDRVKTAKLFELLPPELDDDIRIQQARTMMVPPTNWDEKSIVIYCGDSYEEWAYPSIYKGIGGSEEAVIMMSEQLARLGWDVTVYNKCGSMRGTYPSGDEWGKVEYKPFYHFNVRDNFNILISWRTPGLFLKKLSAKKSYLWLHDILYPEAINQNVIENVDKILFLSQWHSENIPGIPKEKIFITNNGINPKDFENLPPKRPHSLFWGSSYDRGLLPFIKNILPFIKKEIPDVTLDVAYGWQNILKEMDQIPSLKELYTELSPILENTPGITHHGRVSHKKLAELMGSSMVYPYASEFGETNNITSQKCQAAGCYVVTTSQAGGTPERVIYGDILVGDGIYTDPKLQKHFADKVVKLLKQGLPPHDRSVLEAFSWEATAKQWKKELL